MFCTSTALFLFRLRIRLTLQSPPLPVFHGSDHTLLSHTPLPPAKGTHIDLSLEHDLSPATVALQFDKLAQKRLEIDALLLVSAGRPFRGTHAGCTWWT